MARREDKIQVYRVCDLITADAPTFYVEMRLASLRTDGSVKLDRPFPGFVGVIFSKNMIGLRIFRSPRDAIDNFILTQERDIELAQGRIRDALEALQWALEQR